MKKHILIALAVVTTSAFAQTSSVTLYGIVDLGVRHASALSGGNAPAAGSFNGLGSGVDNTSRWGIRGVEDLGGGLRTTFNFESGLAADTGEPVNATKYFDRASWLGLGGGWGRITAGRQTSLLADTVVQTDPLSVRFASFNPAVAVTALSAPGLGIEFGPAGSTAGSYRLDNSLKYVGSIGGLTGGLMYGFGEANNSKSRSSKGALLQYTQQALIVAGAIQTFQASDARKLDAWTLGAAYRVGTLRLAGVVGEHRADTTVTTETRQRVGSFGLTWAALPSVDLTAGYSRVSRSRTGRGGDGYGRLISFAEYKLSARSKLYAEVDVTRWRNGFQGVGIDARATGFTLGMTHSF